MSARREFEMTEDDLEALLSASKPVPYMVFGGAEPRSPRENAHNAWRSLGDRMGFDWETVMPVDKGQRFFSAVPKKRGGVMITYEKSREFVLGAALATALLLAIAIFTLVGAFDNVVEENKALKEELNCPELCQ